MKILHVNTSDSRGGASRAAYRLHRALLETGKNSQLLVQSKSVDDYTILGPQTNAHKAGAALRPFLESLPAKLYKKRTKAPFSPAWVPFSGLAKRINELQPDIVHLHWIGNGMMNIGELSKINAPIVWTLHDSWVFTGGCHVRMECEKYLNECSACPVLGSGNDYDLSNIIFNRKKRVFANIKRLSFTAPSQWLTASASESFLLRSREVLNLPIPLDTQEFSPVDKIIAKKLLNLPVNKRLILFGAESATEDPNKGFKQLAESLNKIITQDAELLVFGSGSPKETQNFKFKAHYLGRLYDNISLKLLYSAADVTVVPSIQEAFGQTASESLSCGTPVVAFATTGLLDIVDHHTNGYLAKLFNTDDLARGIDWVLSNPNYDELCVNARKKVLEQFDSKIVVHKYIQLYSQTLDIH